MKYGLTKKQKQAYDFIVGYISKNDIPPSFNEVMLGVELRSRGGAHRLIHALRDRGYIDFVPKMKRSIVVLQ